MGSGDWHYALTIAGALADARVSISLATMFPIEPFPPVREDVPVYSLGLKPLGDYSRLKLVDRARHHAEKMRRLLALVKDLRPDIVHLQKPLGALDFAYLRYIKSLGPRVAYTIHTPLPPRLNLVVRGRLRQAQLILTHATRTKDQLVKAGIDPRTIHKIYHGNYIHLCQPRTLSPAAARRCLGLPRDARVVLFFGSIEWRKGLDHLIEAFALLARETEDVYLVIAGYPNEDFSVYESQMARLGIRNRVVTDLRWMAYGEMQVYFHAAMVVALPYRRISQSGVLQLAYAYERPLVVTDVGGIAEVVGEDETGLVVRTPSATDFAAALRELLANPDRAAEMGRRGRHLAETKYAWSTIAERVAGLYETLLNGTDDTGERSMG